MQKSLVKNLLIAAVVIGILVIPGLIIYLTGGIGVKAVNPDKLGEQLISYINTNFLAGQATATLEGIKKENGVYKITVKIEGEESIVYTTLDGKVLFLSYLPLNLDSQNATAAETPKTDKPDVNLFVMAFCPYGNQAEDAIKPVIDLLQDKMNLTLNYIVSKYESKYTSLHGEQELNQGIRELCVAKYQENKLWDFVEAINTDCTYEDADTCWESVAEGLGIDIAKIKNCQESEGSALLDAEIALTDQYQVTGSPQVFINGVEYKGDRTPEGYKAGICAAFNVQPSECETELSETGTSAEGSCE